MIEPLKNNNNILYDYKTPLNEFINDFFKVKIEHVDIDCNVSDIIIKGIADVVEEALAAFGKKIKT